MASNPLIGTWRLISWQNRSLLDGEVSYPLGKDAVGYIMYGQDRYMSVAIMRPDRPKFATEIFSAEVQRREREPLAPTCPIAGGMSSEQIRSSIAWNWAYFLTGLVLSRNAWLKSRGID